MTATSTVLRQQGRNTSYSETMEQSCQCTTDELTVDGTSQSFEDKKKFFHSLSATDITQGTVKSCPEQVTCKNVTKPGRPVVPPKPPNICGMKNLVTADNHKVIKDDAKSMDKSHNVNHTGVNSDNANSLEGNHVDKNTTVDIHDEHFVMVQEHEEKDKNDVSGVSGIVREEEESFNNDDDDDWASDEFSDESDSDREAENIENKRISRIIFDERDGIPDVVLLDPRNRKIYNIVKEILTTEITYVEKLGLLDDVFFFRLDNECRAKGAIPKEALLEIFSNIKAIHQLHRDFVLPKLEERMTTWHEMPRVGDIFNFLAPFLRMYAEYVKNFDQAMSSLKKWKSKSQKLAAVITEIQEMKECNCLTLEHHMLGPVQRVPRYRLLLTDYVSKLPEDSEDLEESKKALEIITSAAKHANDSLKKTERFHKMLEMQEKFPEGVSIITPSREFIAEGELVKISARNAQPMPRILILFNDAIFCCAKVAATGKYRVKATAELKNSQVVETDEEIANRELVFRVRSYRKVTDYQASSVEEKEKWVEMLNTAIDRAKEKTDSFKSGGKEVTALTENQLGKIAPVWVKDAAVSMCMECTVAFTTLKRRHHCRACGRIVCSQCSSGKASLEYDDNKINRVCSNCHKILTKGKVKDVKPAGKNLKPVVYADSVFNGYLNFKTENSKPWSKRWCSLGTDFTLHVFRAKKDVKVQVTIPLPGCKLDDGSVLDEAENAGKHVFKVTHKGYGSFVFNAENDETLKSWFSSIEYAIKAETPPSPTSSVSSSLSSPPATPIGFV